MRDLFSIEKLKAMFLIAFLLCTLNSSGYAATSKQINANDMDFANTDHVALATSPSCLLDATGLAAIISEATGGVTSFSGGVIETASGWALFNTPDISGISKAKAIFHITMGTANIISGTAQVMHTAMAGAGFGKCMLSFVTDPREYYPDVLPPDHPDFSKVGKMKRILTDPVTKKFQGFGTVEGSWFKSRGNNYQCKNHGDSKADTNCAFLGMKAKAANKITICSRSGNPTGLLSGIEGCYYAYKDGTDFKGLSSAPSSLHSSGNRFTEDGREYAEGPTALLCPEEYRQVGRLAELDPDSSGYRKLKCTEGAAHSCPKNTMSEKFRGSGDLERYKLYFGAPYCVTGVAGETKSLDGYKFKIVERGTKLCARMVGLIGGIPWSQSYLIGCIEKLNTNVYPKCSESVAIYENFHFDKTTGIITTNGTPCIDGSTGSNCKSPKVMSRLIKYDDSPCYNKCAVSHMCTVAPRGLFQAPIPVTAYLMGCIQDSINNLLYGCDAVSISKNLSSKNEKSTGLLYVIQKRMRPIIMLAIVLAVILFGMKLVLMDSNIKTSEIMTFMIKIALVLYLTNSSTQENGMETYGKYMEKISTALQGMVMNNRIGRQIGTDNVFCDYSDATYKLNVPVAGGETIERDFSYLKVWDLVDCRLAYYFSKGVKAAYISQTNGTNDTLANPYSYTTFDMIASVFNISIMYIILIIICFLFGLMTLFIIIQVVELMILAVIAFHVLILISPIVIPFILFGVTKQTFEGWVNQLITYSLYPVILFSFLGFMFIITDQMFFGQTKFVEGKGYVAGSIVRTFDVDNSKIDYTNSSCAGFQTYKDHKDIEMGKIPVGCDCDGIGCMMNAFVIKTKSNKSIIGPTVGLDLNYQGDSQFKQIQMRFLATIFIMFVLYHISKMMPDIVQSLSGTTKALMNAGRTIRSGASRMEGLAVMAAGLAQGKKTKGKSDDKKGDDKSSEKKEREGDVSAGTKKD